MKYHIISILLICIASSTLFAQLDTALYGLTKDHETCDFKLSKMDPLTGIVTNISSTAVGTSFSSWSISTIDSNNEIFYVVSQDTLLGLDLNTGSIVYNNVISGPVEGQIMLMRYNINDSTLYGVFRDPSEVADVYLSKVDPSTGIVTYISDAPFSDFSVVVNAMATIDPINELYYVFSTIYVYGIDLNTGNVEVYFEANTPPGGFTNLINYNCENGKIYYLWNDILNDFELYLQEMNPINGVEVQLTTNPFGSSSFGDLKLGTIDAYNQLFYVQSQDSIFGIDLSSGEVAASSVVSMPESGSSFNMMNFYPAKNCSDSPVGLMDFDREIENHNITIFPNPVSDLLNIKGTLKSVYWIDLYDLRGVLINRYFNKDINNQQIDMRTLDSGMYLMHVQDDSGVIVIKKIIKQ